MREIKTNQIKNKVKELFLKANFYLNPDLMQRLKEALEEENSPIGKYVLKMIIENNEIASREEVPICQDTGLAVVFVELGQEVHLVGGDFTEAINQGVKEAMSKVTNGEKIKGTLADAIKGADVFLGLSAAGARIVATGRSDFPNQVNNCLGFPAIFKGALKVRARQINEEMKLAAAYALASLISEDELNDNNIIVNAFDPRVVEVESEAVAKAAIESGVARI